MLRNTMAVLLGLLVSISIITLSVMIKTSWIKYNYNGLAIEYWRSIIKNANPNFFIVLLSSSGLASFFGGIICASLVKKAKAAYAMFIGFILFLIAIASISIFKGHPTWYKLSIPFVFFPFSWLGAKTVVYIERKFFNK